MRKNIIIIFTALSLLSVSCKLQISDKTNQTKVTVINAPEDIRLRALDFAKLYSYRNTEYGWGEQEHLRTAVKEIPINEVPIKIDCSGLIIMCYKFALVDTKYSLLLNDMSSSYIYENACTHTKKPKPGDLIFMGNNNINHIGIFVKEENNEIYFIDSTQKDSEGSYPAVNGVTERHYPKTDSRIKGFGIMKLKY